MNSARDRLAARLEFSAPGEKRPDEKPAPDVRPTARVKRIRRTLDLPVARHHEMKKWADELAVVLGLGDVPGQHVLEELVGLFLTDVRTQQMVEAALRKRYEEE